jgi:LuxR family maltose regulon positive regulatory protein
MAAFSGYSSEAIELCERALKQLPEEDRLVRDIATWILEASHLASTGEGATVERLDDLLKWVHRTGNLLITIMAMCNQADLLMRQGQLHESEETYRRVLALATNHRGQVLPIAGQALIGLGDLYREWNDLDAAVQYLNEGIELTRRWTESGPLEGHIALARVRWAQGNLEEAKQELHQAREMAVEFDVTELDDLTVAMFQAWLWILEGEYEPVRCWAEARDLYGYIDSPLEARLDAPYEYRMLKYELLIFARLLIAQNLYDQALQVLEPLVSIAKWRKRQWLLIGTYLLQAMALRRLNETPRALHALEQAVVLGQPAGYVRIFLDEGQEIIDLLHMVISQNTAPQYARDLLVAFGETASTGLVPEPAPPFQRLPEPLSERELDVLRLLDTYLSSTEIAEKLYISANTVRFHIKNIYGKLGVHRRADAVVRAKELNLL